MISSTVITGILLSTVILFTALGVFYSKGKIKGSDDFFTARNSAGVGFLSTTFMASFLGVFILFTPPEAGAIGGISTVILYAFGLGGLYIAFLFLGPKVRNYLPHGSTLNDYVKKRYGRKMLVLTFSVSIFYMVVHLVAELTAIALVAREIAGIPMLFTALMVGLGVAIYTSYGGLRASMFTDLVQMGIVIVLLGIVGIGIFHFVGDPGSIIDQSREVVPTLMTFGNRGGIEFGLTLMIAVFVANLFHQGYWQRIYAGKDQKSLRKSLKISLLLAVPIMILTGSLGIMSVGLGYAEHPSVAMFSLIYSTFPLALIIVVFILALVLVMSTVDTLLNALVTSFSVDTGSFKGTAENTSTTKWVKGLALLIILPSAYIASMGFSVLYLFLLADLLCAGLVFPLFYGLYQPKLSERVALSASILGIISGVPFFLQNQLLVSFTLPIIVSIVAVFIGMAFETKRQELAKESSS